MNERSTINGKIYKIRKRLEFDDAVKAAGNPPTLDPDDRHELIDELDRLYEKKRADSANDAEAYDDAYSSDKFGHND